MTPSAAWHVARPLLTAVITALLAYVFLFGVAQAQDAAPVPSGVTPIDLAWGGVAVLLVNVVVLFARALWSATLAPDPATPASRRATQIVGLAAGLFFGLIGLAQVVPVDVAIPGALWIGRGASGLLVAGLAMFGRDAVVKGARKVKRPPPAAPGAV